MNAKVTDLMETIGIREQAAVEIVAIIENSLRKEKRRIPTEQYSRVVGYIRPVNQWNKGKQEEFRERKTYKMKEA